MKFTNGYWLLREGMTALYPAQVYKVRTSARSVTAVVPTKAIASRNDVVDTPVLTVELSSPLPGVIKVRVSHFTGGLPQRPEFPLAADPDSAVAVAVEKDEITLTSGSLTARFR